MFAFRDPRSGSPEHQKNGIGRRIAKNWARRNAKGKR